MTAPYRSPVGVRTRIIVFLALSVADIGCGREYPKRHPLLLGFPLRSRGGRVVALDPVRGAARAVARVPALRHDALEPELAGVLEDKRAVRLVEVLVEAQARRGTREEARERGLFRLQTRPCLTIRKCDGHQLDRATTLSALAPYLPSPTSAIKLGDSCDPRAPSVFAVAYNVDAGLGLQAHCLDHRLGEAGLECRFVIRLAHLR